VSLASRKAIGAGLTGLTGGSAALIVAMLVFILWDVVAGGWTRISLEFLTQAPTEGMTEGGIFPAIYGTAVLTLLMTVAVMPVGVATAIYLHEYAPKGGRLAEAVRIAVQNLAGVPSIVFGLFGLGFFIQFVGRGLDRGLSPEG
jgi:phosphate transport system permease protein